MFVGVSGTFDSGHLIRMFIDPFKNGSHWHFPWQSVLMCDGSMGSAGDLRSLLLPMIFNIILEKMDCVNRARGDE